MKATNATATILRAMMEELHGENRISIDAKADREEYVDFIALDIMNACNKFGGRLNQIRFHPIMANLAMNMYIGMAYKDMVDVMPFCFPTMRTMQRSRAEIATHEGTDPKVYAKVSEKNSFRLIVGSGERLCRLISLQSATM